MMYDIFVVFQTIRIDYYKRLSIKLLSTRSSAYSYIEPSGLGPRWSPGVLRLLAAPRLPDSSGHMTMVSTTVLLQPRCRALGRSYHVFVTQTD